MQTTETTGRVVIDDAVVTLDDLKGKTLDGSIGASGTLDFSGNAPRFDLKLRLRDVDVTKAPPSWQLGEVGATGRLSGNLGLKVALPSSGPDLTGTVGRAVIENGSFHGIPIKSLSLGMKAEGNDLQYATMPEGSVDRKNLDLPDAPSSPPMSIAGASQSVPRYRIELWEPVLAALPLLELASNRRGVLGWTAYAVSELVSYQVKHATGPDGGIRLPRTISTHIELEDVDLVTILEKARKFGIEIPVPIAGRLSIKASATIPLGSLRDLKGYVFRGDATLKGASIDHVDLGLVTAHLEFVDGVLDLSDFRGQLVDKPSGDDKNPPRPTLVPPSIGALPPGAFRGRLRAMISPRGKASASLEGDHLPLGELFAPVLPVPTPLSGELTLKVDASGDLGKLADARSWVLDGRLESRRIKYLQAVLDEIATDVHLKAGQIELADFAAKLSGRPLKANGGLDLAAPHRFRREALGRRLGDRRDPGICARIAPPCPGFGQG